MNKFFNFLAGMVLGALIGAGVALLFAPMSGQELRSSAQSRAQQTVDEMKMAVAEERRRLETELESLKHGEIKIS